jgi:hypothetical protein
LLTNRGRQIQRQQFERRVYREMTATGSIRKVAERQVLAQEWPKMQKLVEDIVEYSKDPEALARRA